MEGHLSLWRFKGFKSCVPRNKEGRWAETKNIFLTMSVWLCSNETLVMDAEIWIPYSVHISRNILLLIFIQPFHNVKTILSLRAGQKQAAGWIWTISHRLPFPTFKGPECLVFSVVVSLCLTLPVLGQYKYCLHCLYLQHCYDYSNSPWLSLCCFLCGQAYTSWLICFWLC